MALDMQRTDFVSPPGKGTKAVGACAGKARRWLPLAAAPAFFAMAVASAFAPPTMPCSTMADGFSLSGMTAMYLLMGVFHLPPWLNRIGMAR